MKYFFFTVLLFLSLPALSQDDVVQKGQELPDFSITTDAATIKSADLKGKVILINFFATWCVPCIQELPYLQKEVWEKYKNNPHFTLLVIGRGHSAEEVNNFRLQRKFALPMYPDKEQSIYQRFAKHYIPRNYIINAKGKIVYTSMGYNPDEFKEMLKKLHSLLD
jgi:peroxiredoxin